MEDKDLKFVVSLNGTAETSARAKGLQAVLNKFNNSYHATIVMSMVDSVSTKIKNIFSLLRGQSGHLNIDMSAGSKKTFANLSSTLSNMFKSDANKKWYEKTFGYMESIGKTAIGIGDKLVGAFTIGGAAIYTSMAVAAGILSKQVVSINSQMEQFTVSLQTTLGSLTAAKQVMSDIVQFAKETPYQIKEVTDAVVRLSAYKMDTKQWLTPLGNAASAFGRDITDAVEMAADAVQGQFRRAMSYGIRLSKEDFKANGKFAGMTMSDALLQILNERFAGGMELQAKTLKGIWSNIKDSMYIGFQQATAPIYGVIKAQVSKFYAYLSSNEGQARLNTVFAMLASYIAKVIDTAKVVYSYVVANILPVAVQVGKTMMQTFSTVSGMIKPILTSLTPLIAFFMSLISLVTKLMNVFKPLLQVFIAFSLANKVMRLLGVSTAGLTGHFLSANKGATMLSATIKTFGTSLIVAGASFAAMWAIGNYMEIKNNLKEIGSSIEGIANTSKQVKQYLREIGDETGHSLKEMTKIALAAKEFGTNEANVLEIASRAAGKAQEGMPKNLGDFGISAEKVTEAIGNMAKALIHDGDSVEEMKKKTKEAGDLFTNLNRIADQTGMSFDSLNLAFSNNADVVAKYGDNVKELEFLVEQYGIAAKQLGQDADPSKFLSALGMLLAPTKEMLLTLPVDTWIAKSFKDMKPKELTALTDALQGAVDAVDMTSFISSTTNIQKDIAGYSETIKDNYMAAAGALIKASKTSATLATNTGMSSDKPLGFGGRVGNFLGTGGGLTTMLVGSAVAGVVLLKSLKSVASKALELQVKDNFLGHMLTKMDEKRFAGSLGKDFLKRLEKVSTVHLKALTKSGDAALLKEAATNYEELAKALKKGRVPIELQEFASQVKNIAKDIAKSRLGVGVGKAAATTGEASLLKRLSAGSLVGILDHKAYESLLHPANARASVYATGKIMGDVNALKSGDAMVGRATWLTVGPWQTKFMSKLKSILNPFKGHEGGYIDFSAELVNPFKRSLKQVVEDIKMLSPELAKSLSSNLIIPGTEEKLSSLLDTIEKTIDTGREANGRFTKNNPYQFTSETAPKLYGATKTAEASAKAFAELMPQEVNTFIMKSAQESASIFQKELDNSASKLARSFEEVSTSAAKVSISFNKVIGGAFAIEIGNAISSAIEPYLAERVEQNKDKNLYALQQTWKAMAQNPVSEGVTGGAITGGLAAQLYKSIAQGVAEGIELGGTGLRGGLAAAGSAAGGFISKTGLYAVLASVAKAGFTQATDAISAYRKGENLVDAGLSANTEGMNKYEAFAEEIKFQTGKFMYELPGKVWGDVKNYLLTPAKDTIEKIGSLLTGNGWNAPSVSYAATNATVDQLSGGGTQFADREKQIADIKDANDREVAYEQLKNAKIEVLQDAQATNRVNVLNYITAKVKMDYQTMADAGKASTISLESELYRAKQFVEKNVRGSIASTLDEANSLLTNFEKLGTLAADATTVTMDKKFAKYRGGGIQTLIKELNDAVINGTDMSDAKMQDLFQGGVYMLQVMNKELEKATIELNDYTQQVNDAQDEFNALTRDVTTFANVFDLAIAKNELRLVQDDVFKLETALAKLNNKLAVAENEMVPLKNALDDAERGFNKVQKAIGDAQNQLDKFMNAPVKGEGAYQEQLYQIDKQINALNLKKLTLQPTADAFSNMGLTDTDAYKKWAAQSGYEAIDTKIAELQHQKEKLDLNRTIATEEVDHARTMAQIGDEMAAKDIINGIAVNEAIIKANTPLLEQKQREVDMAQSIVDNKQLEIEKINKSISLVDAELNMIKSQVELNGTLIRQGQTRFTANKKIADLMAGILDTEKGITKEGLIRTAIALANGDITQENFDALMADWEDIVYKAGEAGSKLQEAQTGQATTQIKIDDLTALSDTLATAVSTAIGKVDLKALSKSDLESVFGKSVGISILRMSANLASLVSLSGGIPSFANGGITGWAKNIAKNATIHGQEAVIPLKNGYVPVSLSGDSSSSGVTNNFGDWTFVVRGDNDLEEVKKVLVKITNGMVSPRDNVHQYT